LYVIQTWGLASKNKPTLSYMSDTYSLLKAEGVQFPPINENIDGILLETAAVSFMYLAPLKR
jgi:growth factor-regulated tyrosine kinase substrate